MRIDDGREDSIPAADLKLVEERAEFLLLGRAGVAGWRLKLDRPVPEEIVALLPEPERYGRWVDRIGLGRAAVAGALLSAAVLAIGYFAPAWLTPLVPPSWERSYGEALVGDFGGKFCRAPDGRRALARLAARLDVQPDELNIRVVDIDLVNAVALPGGNIVIFRGLLAEADGPDEVAGVLAHEIAHVRNRHVTEAMLRQFGVGLLVATVGGSTGGNVESVLSLSYSRGAEREADADAIQALKRAHVSPLPTARFFDRLAKTEADFGGFDQAIAYLSTHPVSRSREQAFAKSADERARYTPALSPADWTALRAICTHPADETVAKGGRAR
jgi:Zn-dependent protease with chaperone function